MSIKLFILFINLVLVNKLYKLGMILLVIMVGWMKLNKVVFVCLNFCCVCVLNCYI